MRLFSPLFVFGKSTLARALADKLGYGYIDTGAMYRAVTYYFLENRVNIQKTIEMERALSRINITFKNTVGGNRTFLNGKDVEDVIRKMFVSKNVSHVAAISTVRKMVVKQQKEMGKQKGIVMEGRDIGTVVFPNAKLKIFLTADQDVRTKRRYDELTKKGQKVSVKTIKDNLLERDHIDSTRKDSPLKKAKEAVLIDNSNITPREQMEMVLALSKERIRRLSLLAKKVVATKPKSESQSNTRPAPSKKTNPRNQNQKPIAKKVVAQKAKPAPQKRNNQPIPKTQNAEQKKTNQNLPTKKVAPQKTKPAAQKRTNQPVPKTQKQGQKKTNQNQSIKKVVAQKAKPATQKRNNQAAPKTQKAGQKKTNQNQSIKKVVAQKAKSTTQKKANQTESKSQTSAQQEFLNIQPKEKPVERKKKATPQRRAKQPSKKTTKPKAKPTPIAKKQAKKAAPKNLKTKPKAAPKKTTNESSPQEKKKKVRTKRKKKTD